MMVTEFPPRPGGVSDYSEGLARAIQRKGTEVSVLTFREAGLVETEDIENGIKLYRSISPGLASGIDSIKAAKKIRPDLVHIQLTTFLFNPSFYAFPLLNDSIPLIITAHDVPRSHRAVHMLPFVRLALHKSTRVISLSDNVRSILLSFHRIPSAKVTRIPFHVDMSKYNPALRTDETRRQLGWQGKFVVLMAGFHNPGKGVHVLLEAIHQAQIPQIHLVIAGKFWKSRGPSLERGELDSYEQFILKSIARLGLQRVVDLRGYVPSHEFPFLLANADAAVLPYLYSYQSSLMHLALASGCPIVASNIPGFQEFISNGRTGLLASPGEPLDLAEKLRWLYEDHAAAMKLAAAARRFAEEAFDADVAASMHLHEYGQILSDR